MSIDGKLVIVGIPHPQHKEKEKAKKPKNTHQTSDVYMKKLVRGKSKGGARCGR